ncbi:MAG: sulfatase [Acidobacteria bacterium]|nr:sulfatase [Acidobacteriota bacterium]
MPVPLSRRDFLASGLALAAARPACNVLFIAVDDLKPNLGCYGDLLAISPNIDRLAAQGLTFTRAYCQQAVCSPSRTSLLTGRRPDTTRVYDLRLHFRKTLPDVAALPEHFRRNGYVTTGFSKIYHPGLDDRRSWSIPSWAPGRKVEWNTPANAGRAEKEEAGLRERNWLANPTPPRSDEDRVRRGPSWRSLDVADNDQPDGKTANAVVNALGALRGERFFLAAGFLKPHLPFVAPKRYFDLYRNANFSLAVNPGPPQDAPPCALHDSGELRAYLDIPKSGPIPDAKALELIRAYYAAMSYTDAQIGKVLAELDRLGLRRNTVVILWGDHGYHLGDHGLWNKHTNFEQATRVPMIISVPGQKTAGRKTAALSEFVDIYPSLAEICGLPAPEGVEGTSFAPLLTAPDRAWKKAAFSQYPRGIPGAGAGMGHSLRTERYRYTEWRVPGKDFRAAELYDYQTDPLEKINLAAQPRHAALVRELSALLAGGWPQALPR